MSNIISENIDDTYRNSIQIASSHYENFPVASILIPGNLRKHVAIVYRFARQADDLADEGNFLPEVRMELLNKYESDLTLALRKGTSDPFWAALAKTINELSITDRYFYDLIKAFKQDVFKFRYETFDDVLYYCRHSANPVGRIILEIFNIRNMKAMEYSDHICSALQLTNFLQDTMIDYSRGRIYIPANEMRSYNVTGEHFEDKLFNSGFKKLIEAQVSRVNNMFDYGSGIISYLPGRLAYEIKWTILGGRRVLEKIRANDYNVFKGRPKLSKIDYFSLLLKVLFK